jgi:hypothetical protein
MVRVRGLEPLPSAFQVRSSAGLSYTLIDLERATGLEPACLPVRSRRFIHLNYARMGWSGRRDLNPRFPA